MPTPLSSSGAAAAEAPTAAELPVSAPYPDARFAHYRVFRDGRWILQDLASTNGTTVNGLRVGRCELRPGDRVQLGNHQLLVD